MIEVEAAVVERGAFRLTASLTVPSGAVCALVGPSGSGKSTLLEGIAGFLPLASGRIRVAGQDVTGQPPAERPVTLLFQSDNLFPHLTVERNVGLGLKPSLSLTAQDRAAIAAVLEEVGMGGLADRLPGALSGGQRQRAALARALLRERPALLLDEPLAALGPALRDEMLALIERAAKGRGLATLMITHAPEEARGIADLTAVCIDGRIDGVRPTAAVLADPDPALAAYLGTRQS